MEPRPFSSPQRNCVAATAIIWGCSTGMLAIDLLLATGRSGTVVAVAIVTAAAASTMTIWISAGITSKRQESERE